MSNVDVRYFRQLAQRAAAGEWILVDLLCSRALVRHRWCSAWGHSFPLGGALFSAPRSRIFLECILGRFWRRRFWMDGRWWKEVEKIQSWRRTNDFRGQWLMKASTEGKTKSYLSRSSTPLALMAWNERRFAVCARKKSIDGRQLVVVGRFGFGSGNGSPERKNEFIRFRCNIVIFCSSINTEKEKFIRRPNKNEWTRWFHIEDVVRKRTLEKVVCFFAIFDFG